ncbi:MAG: glycosyltransferase [Desulfofustis sp.]|nr:glycosyltransferase [Desulfofustis sp.]NNF45591.1 glycosyltransferase [Desulfofustis sp.]
MYSHDTYGLGHIRRTMAIANHLRGTNTNILILTGSPLAGRFALPSQVDFVRIPGMIKKTNDEYRSLSIKIEDQQALSIRTNIILATAQTFKPDLFIVDKEPLGLKREVLPTLEWFKQSTFRTRTILGLRDILDDPSVIVTDWQERDIYSYLELLYDEIWVYGNQQVYDPVSLYRFPEGIKDRVVFTGYIPRIKKHGNVRKKIRRRYRIMPNDTFLLVTTGGGGDGYDVLDKFVDMHDYFPTTLPFKSLIITGPFMPKRKREEIKKRGKVYGIKTLPFHSRLEELMQAADLVISMGGYNTICEILTQQTPALIIPRETPRKEQLIRAQCLKSEGLIDYLGWHEISPQKLREKIFSILDRRQGYSGSMAHFELTGINTMLERLAQFRQPNSTSAAAPPEPAAVQP